MRRTQTTSGGRWAGGGAGLRAGGGLGERVGCWKGCQKEGGDAVSRVEALLEGVGSGSRLPTLCSPGSTCPDPLPPPASLPPAPPACRHIAVHPTLPYILTCSDDMLIKLWDWDKGWQCTQIFEGHSHYVMQVGSREGVGWGRVVAGARAWAGIAG